VIGESNFVVREFLAPAWLCLCLWLGLHLDSVFEVGVVLEKTASAGLGGSGFFGAGLVLVLVLIFILRGTSKDLHLNEITERCGGDGTSHTVTGPSIMGIGLGLLLIMMIATATRSALARPSSSGIAVVESRGGSCVTGFALRRMSTANGTANDNAGDGGFVFEFLGLLVLGTGS
jgi:hypothetical protein